MSEIVKTVAELTTYISDLFDYDSTLQDVWITGEVSNMTRASSGHWYFTLKDADASIKCVMWRSAAARQTTTPNDGDALEVHGKVSIYAPRGEYQMYADLARPVGAGDLYAQFERLKVKLEMEGLFDSERKREFPPVPVKIGVVTSPTAAAFQDVLNVLRRRYPLVQVILSPTMVQGAEAPVQIIAALDRLNMFTDVDVILMVRGGGSIEDLWSFNDERVARAVAASHIPVVTGVGHETDFTIVDFVSDHRAPTPSAAAELVTPDKRDILERLGRTTEMLDGLTYDAILTRRNKLERVQAKMTYISPSNTIRISRQRVDDYNDRLLRQQKNQIALLRERLSGKTAALEAANPRAILARGYALITDEDGNRITSERDAKRGTNVDIQFKDGKVKAWIRGEDDGYDQPTLF